MTTNTKLPAGMHSPGHAAALCKEDCGHVEPPGMCQSCVAKTIRARDKQWQNRKTFTPNELSRAEQIIRERSKGE